MTGTVESLAPGSGSTFALLPFEPGTGNFTKIVQRVPVRIRFDADQPGLERLRPGLSVIAKVDLDAPSSATQVMPTPNSRSAPTASEAHPHCRPPCSRRPAMGARTMALAAVHTTRRWKVFPTG